MKERLISKETLEGILKWGVDGAIAWYASRKGLETPEPFKEALNDARKELDLTAQWLKDNCIIDRGNQTIHTPYTELYKNFSQWCNTNGESNPWKDRTFNKIMRDKGFIEGSMYHDFEEFTVGGTRKVKKKARGLFGVSLLPS